MSAQAIEKVEPKYKPSQAALTAFFKLHEPSDENWKAPFAVLEVTDGCPLNGMYRRCVASPFFLPPGSHSRDQFRQFVPTNAARITLELLAECWGRGRFKMWIHEGMTAFPNLKLKTLPGMDPIMQFQETESVPEGDLGIARVDVSVSRPLLVHLFWLEWPDTRIAKEPQRYCREFARCGADVVDGRLCVCRAQLRPTHVGAQAAPKPICPVRN